MNVHLTEADLADAVDRENVIQFKPRAEAVDIERHADLHRQCVAKSEQRIADAKRGLKNVLAASRAARKALKAQYDADLALIAEREEQHKADTEDFIDKNQRLAGGSRAWLQATGH